MLDKTIYPGVALAEVKASAVDREAKWAFRFTLPASTLEALSVPQLDQRRAFNISLGCLHL